MRQLPRVIAAVGMMAFGLLAGCQQESNWFSQQEEPKKDVAQSASEIADTWGRLGYRVAWHSFATMASAEGHVAMLDLDPEAVLAMDDTGILTRLSPTSGQYKWATVVQRGYTQFFTTVRIRDRVYSMSQSDIYVMEGETGALLGRQKLDKVAATRPARFGDLIVYGTNSGQVVAHLCSTGYMVWAYALNGPIVVDPQPVGDGSVVSISDVGDVIVQDATTGASEGRSRMYSGSGSPPAVTADTIYVASKDQSLYAINTAGGAVRWRYRTETPLVARPVVWGNNVHIDMPGRGLLAIDTHTGIQAWVAEGVNGVVLTVHDGKLVVWNGREVVLVDAVHGDVIARVGMSDVQILKADKLDNGALYAVFPTGQVSKFVVK